MVGSSILTHSFGEGHTFLTGDATSGIQESSTTFHLTQQITGACQLRALTQNCRRIQGSCHRSSRSVMFRIPSTALELELKTVFPIMALIVISKVGLPVVFASALQLEQDPAVKPTSRQSESGTATGRHAPRPSI